MKTYRFGIIGAGLMGREFASAAARWCHLTDLDARPELVAVCDMNPALFPWYTGHFPSVRQTTTAYQELLANPAVEAVYVAVPHNLHQQVYCDVLAADKHLMGEKPFGIDLPACEAIIAATRQRPDQLVRCSSESPFFPALQQLCGYIEQGAFGRLIEVNTGFLHSSDLDQDKPINWKRRIEFNGEYGVMGDLGMHACHVVFRAGWQPRNVRALLSDIVKERPDGQGGRAPCKTWDNATLLCETLDPRTSEPFPWTLKLQRIAPGQKNNWYVEVLGTQLSARWSSVQADVLEVMEYHPGVPQAWQQIQTGYDTAFKTITGGIFQFGFTDSIQQMWAAYLHELAHGQPKKPFAGCVTPDEALLSHQLFTAALESQRRAATVALATDIAS
ncbi:MAG: Gfo/Idh/MocA family oxidoreductase [Candidatus Marinimicrobia bacterium]|nr:Gfo/Idh/MocA family oxidoreductase [Candidatus Neomarinimicrobiota bacterium]